MAIVQFIMHITLFLSKLTKRFNLNVFLGMKVLFVVDFSVRKIKLDDNPDDNLKIKVGCFR